MHKYLTVGLGLLLGLAAAWAGEDPATVPTPLAATANSCPSAKPDSSPGAAETKVRPTGEDWYDLSHRGDPIDVMATLRLVPQATRGDLAAIEKLAAGIDKDAACPADKGNNTRYYTGIAHRLHGLLPIGFADHGRDPNEPPPAGRFYCEFHLDATSRLVAIVGHNEKGDRYLTDRLIYKGGDLVARLSFSPKGFEFGDYGVWRGGKLRMTGRVMANGKVASYECIFWRGGRKDHTVRFAGWDRPEPDKIPVQSIDFGTVRIEMKPNGMVDGIFHYSFDPFRESEESAAILAAVAAPPAVLKAAGPETKPAASATQPATQLDSPKFLVLDLGDKVTMKLAPIPAGKFMMGSPKNEKGRAHNWAGADGVQRPEEAEHEVTITRPFHMGIYPVTQRQYEAVMGVNPSYFKGADNPVEGVTWQQAVEFCGKLAAITGRTVRLPTDAQWEYACRAGTKTPFNTGETITTDQVNFDGSFVFGNGFVQAKNGLHRDRTTPVGTFKPNSWGLCDMHGNVWQWCSDWWGEMSAQPAVDPCGPATGQEHVMRGGCWMAFAWTCRSACRGGIPAGGRYTGPGGYFGFRVVVADEFAPSSGQPTLPAKAVPRPEPKLP